MNRIFHVLEDIGPNGGPVNRNQVCRRLLLDSSLTDRQRTFMFQDVFKDAFREGMWISYVEEFDGGVRGGRRDHVWYWNEGTNDMWLYKWGEVPVQMMKKNSR